MDNSFEKSGIRDPVFHGVLEFTLNKNKRRKNTSTTKWIALCCFLKMVIFEDPVSDSHYYPRNFSRLLPFHSRSIYKHETKLINYSFRELNRTRFVKIIRLSLCINETVNTTFPDYDNRVLPICQELQLQKQGHAIYHKNTRF